MTPPCQRWQGGSFFSGAAIRAIRLELELASELSDEGFLVQPRLKNPREWQDNESESKAKRVRAVLSLMLTLRQRTEPSRLPPSRRWAG